MSDVIAVTAAVLGIPNFFGLNSPEIYKFTVGSHTYSLISGVSGIFNHAHKLVKVEGPVNANAVFYFSVQSEYMHSHPTRNHIYYVGIDDEIYYFNVHNEKSKKVSFLEIDAGHRHSINVIKH